MDVQQALEMIDQLEYKPGWDFEGGLTESVAGTVWFTVSFDAPNSDAHYAPLYKEPMPFPICRVFNLFVEDCDDQDLEDLLLDCILRAENHEAREFFAFRRHNPTRADASGLDKPFHPHTALGMRRWQHRALTRPLGHGDVQTTLLGLGGTF